MCDILVESDVFLLLVLRIEGLVSVCRAQNCAYVKERSCVYVDL